MIECIYLTNPREKGAVNTENISVDLMKTERVFPHSSTLCYKCILVAKSPRQSYSFAVSQVITSPIIA